MIREWDSTRFTFDRWESNWWHALDMTFDCSLINKDLVRRKIKEYAVGWCNGDRLPVRPKPGKVVMIEKDDDLFWFHLDDSFFDEIFK